MRNWFRVPAILVLVMILGCLPAFPRQQGKTTATGDQPRDEKKDRDPMSSSTFTGLRLRSIGPALTSGRVAAFAVNPKNRGHYFVAAASGGVWKTTNAGTTWRPVFDRQGSYSIGSIALDPKNPSIVWVGTGENNSQRSVSYGDGVYRSDDGGKSWKNLGLKASEHIGRIVIDPRRTKTVYVAAQGPLWGPGGDRGLYKTTNGGGDWEKILSISENTGVTDLVMDPTDPDVLYAASYQRRRRVWTMINGGPEGALYKSTDAGESWKKLKSGLPHVDLGRIGLAISPADANVLYATIEAADQKGGIFRSRDRGATWERRNKFDSTAMYYSQIVADPKDVDRIYVLNTNIMVSDDGGKTLVRFNTRSKHVDNHAMWIDPSDTNYILVGCDGGVYESFDRGENWSFKSNLPITQFYDIAVDNDVPFYQVYGGTQDNFSLGGPARSRNASGITNGDWFVTQGGDGFRSKVDPEDPNTVYAESQYGGLVRFNRLTGQRMGIKPREGRGEHPLRWNWDSPLIISHHSHTRLYFAANKLFRSDDRGDTWKAISGELSRAIDRNKLPVMGRVWGPDAVAKSASTSFYGNVVALVESSKKEGLLYAGTDDGLIQVTEDGGAHWRRIEKFPGVPDQTYVSRILASQHETRTVYAAFDNHKNADFSPYLLESKDSGRSWKSIKGNLPDNGPVLALAEDHVNPELLFVGTEFGLHFTIDGGKKWVQLKGGLPTIAVRDLAIQKRENDLVLGTFGRGIYILDDYSSLRLLRPEMLAKKGVLFPPKDSLMYIPSQPFGRGKKGFLGEAFYVAPNPPFGAAFTFYLKDSFKTRKQKRQAAEKAAIKKGTTLDYPTEDELRREADEVAPEIIFTVKDSVDRVVRRLRGKTSAGIQRVTWDLRYPASTVSRRQQRGTPFRTPTGPLVMPGVYTVSVAQKVDGQITQLGSSQSFSVIVEGTSEMTGSDRAALVAFQQKVSRLQGAVSGALRAAGELKTRMGLIKQALYETPAAGPELTDRARSIEERLDAILRALRGDSTLRRRGFNVSSSISQRVNGIVGDQRMSTSPPTQTQKDGYEIASQDFTQVMDRFRKLVDEDLAGLEKAMEDAGAPWTPGRIPVWKNP